MTYRSKTRAATTRLTRALLIVAGIMIVAPTLNAVASMTSDYPGHRGSQPGIEARSLVAEGDPFAVVDRIEAASKTDGAQAPDTFMAEMGMPERARDVRVNEAGSVIGYVVEGRVDTVLERVDELMCAKGWKGVSLGDVTGSTYVKSDGTYEWALVTGTQVGADTSVVVRCIQR